MNKSGKTYVAALGVVFLLTVSVIIFPRSHVWAIEIETFIGEAIEKANHGDVASQVFLGFSYSEGKGVAQDYEKSIKWYSMAAKAGDAGSQTALAGKYQLGLGVPQDFEKAFFWYSKAAEQGDSGGQFFLGLLYLYGPRCNQGPRPCD